MVPSMSSRETFAAMQPINIATIPRAEAGCRELLSAIRWPEGEKGQKKGAWLRRSHEDDPEADLGRQQRIVLAGSGLWYNLHPFCSGVASLFTQGNRSDCAKVVNGMRVPADRMELRHSAPHDSWPTNFTARQKYYRFGYVPTWGWYSWGRR